MSTAQREAERFYTVAEAATLKSVSQDVIRRAIHATEGPVIRAKKVGGRIRIPASALEDWADALPDA